MSRFSQAISEGDGISVIPVLEGNVGDLAALAEQAGAEAIAVSMRDADRARLSTTLPVIIDGDVSGHPEVEGLASAGADGWIAVLDPAGGERIEELYPVAMELGVDCAVEVRDEERLADALERLDPEILVIAHPGGEEEEELEYMLDLLPDVPAGKLVIARTRRPIDRDQVVALERAGVDAILVGVGFLRDPDFVGALAELTGRAETA